MTDKWPDKPRIAAVRDNVGALIGFALKLQWNGEHTLSQHATMQAALAHLTEFTDKLYGPLRVYPEALV